MEPDWQTKLSTMQDRCRHLLQTKSFTDCCFLVGADESRQSHIKAHKAMLAVASPVFERMFYGSIPEQPEPICVTDIDPEIFNAMLGSIYMDDFHVKSVDIASDLFHAAQKYMLTHLQQKCLAFIESVIDVKNVCRIYEFGKLFDLVPLQERCMNLIKVQTLRVLNESSFLEISLSTFQDILDQDSLAINSELDLFNALLKYASHKGIYKAEHNAVNEQPKNVAAEVKEEPSKIAKSKVKSTATDMTTNITPTPTVIALKIKRHCDDRATTSGDATAKSENNGNSFEHNQFVIITKKETPTTPEKVASTSDESLLGDSEQIDEPFASQLPEIQNLIKKLRLLTLQPREFSEIAEHEKLIPSDVALAIFIHIPNVKLKKTYAILDDYDCNRKSRCVVNANCDFPMLEVRTLNGHGFAFNPSTFQELPTEFNFHNNNDNNNTVNMQQPLLDNWRDLSRNKLTRMQMLKKGHSHRNGTE